VASAKCRAGHRGRIGQIQLRDLHRFRARREIFGDVAGDFLTGHDVAHGQRHLGAR
jgi:hypothetical protein